MPCASRRDDNIDRIPAMMENLLLRNWKPKEKTLDAVMTELRWAQSVVSLSLCFLLGAIRWIIISFAIASFVEIEDSFHGSDLLFSPFIIGWFFCFLGIGCFLIRLIRKLTYISQEFDAGNFQINSHTVSFYIVLLVAVVSWICCTRYMKLVLSFLVCLCRSQANLALVRVRI